MFQPPGFPAHASNEAPRQAVSLSGGVHERCTGRSRCQPWPPEIMSASSGLARGDGFRAWTLPCPGWRGHECSAVRRRRADGECTGTGMAENTDHPPPPCRRGPWGGTPPGRPNHPHQELCTPMYGRAGDSSDGVRLRELTSVTRLFTLKRGPPLLQLNQRLTPRPASAASAAGTDSSSPVLGTAPERQTGSPLLGPPRHLTSSWASNSRGERPVL